VRSGGVTVAAKNELDRVEQRTVEIEEIGVEPVLRLAMYQLFRLVPPFVCLQ